MTSRILPTELSFLAPTIIDDLVRVGSQSDGGYVIPERLIAMSDMLISMGINDDWSFEDDISHRNRELSIHGYDHTISKAIFKRGLIYLLAKLLIGRGNVADVTRRFRVLRSYDRFFSGSVKHFCERIHNRIDGPTDANFSKVLQRTNSNNILLKIDIEGSEYRIIRDIVSSHERIIGLVIEFHETDPLRSVFCSAVKLLQSQFELVHVHGNNYASISEDGLPEALELTFIRKDLCPGAAKRFELPLPGLDRPNNALAADYAMRFAV